MPPIMFTRGLIQLSESCLHRTGIQASKKGSGADSNMIFPRIGAKLYPKPIPRSINCKDNRITVRHDLFSRMGTLRSKHNQGSRSNEEGMNGFGAKPLGCQTIHPLMSRSSAVPCPNDLLSPPCSLISLSTGFSQVSSLQVINFNCLVL